MSSTPALRLASHVRLAQGGVRDTRAGFTLIELLVVVLVIGILATLVGLSVSNRSAAERLYNEAERLEQLLKLALEEAEIKGVQIGFRYTNEGYEFLGMDEQGQWTVMEGTGPLRPRELGKPFTIQLRVEGRIVPPAPARELAGDSGEGPPLEPQFLLLSSGEVMPFLLWLGDEREREGGYLVQGELTGSLQLQPWNRELWSDRARKKS